MTDGFIMNLILLDISKDLPQIKKIWTELGSSPEISYFLSWGWVENWLTSLPKEAQPRLAVFSKNDTPLIAFFLRKADLLRHHMIKSRGLFVNATGVRYYDNIWIEYNHFLKAPFVEIPLSEIVALLPEPWDEFYMPGLDGDTFPGNALDKPFDSYHVIIEEESPSPYVDLDLVRAKAGNYLSLLSSNTRSQIKRSYRLYESRGPILMDVARNLEEALEIFDEMTRLHLRLWEQRDKRTPLSSDYVYDFHKQLIQKRFEQGEIQLLRIRAGQMTIGCLYNFIFNRKVYFYQSGMNYERDKRLKPGFVSHVEAVKYNAEVGLSFYDFLGGYERYKMSLATDEKRLIWAKIQKPLLRFSFENRVKALKRSLLDKIR